MQGSGMAAFYLFVYDAVGNREGAQWQGQKHHYGPWLWAGF
jgi:hypothetical protein